MLDQHDYAAAIALYTKIIEQEPDTQEAWLLLGSLHGEAGDLDELVRHLKQAIKLDLEDSRAHLTLGHVLQAMGSQQEALSSFQNATLYDPENAEAFCTCGAILSEEGRWQEAIDSFKKAVQLDPDNAAAWSMLGYLYYTNGNVDMACDAYKAAIQRDMSNTRASIGLCASLRLLGRSGEVEQVISDALALEPDDPDLLYEKLEMLMEQGKLGEALEHSEQLLQGHPGNSRFITRHADILEKRGDADAAFTCLRPLLESADIPLEAVLIFGKISYELGMVDECRTLLDNISGKDSTNEQDLKVTAEVRVMLG